jgi:DNA-binding Xre family transcriptional regulator
MVKIQLDAYLDRLKGAEGYQRVSERRQVPTYVELANESGISPVTLSRIANGHIKQLNLSVLASIITSLRRRGFATDVSDLLVYHSDSMNDELHAGEMMKAFRELTHQELKLQQPSARKKEYELRADNELVGTLHWPKVFFSLCIAETADGSWTFNRHGFFNLRVSARVAGSEQDVLIYMPNWTGMNGTMKHRDGREFNLHGANWWGNRFKLVQKPAQGEDVELLDVKINFYFLRGSADVAIHPKLAQTEDASLLAMFSCYLAVMAYEDMAAGGTISASAASAV